MAPVFVPSQYLQFYIDTPALKAEVSSLVKTARRQRAAVLRRLEILQRPGLPSSGGATWTQRKVDANGEEKCEPFDAEASGPHPDCHATTTEAQRANLWKSGGFWVEAEALALLPESRFWSLLQRQVGRLNSFASSKARSIENELQSIARRIHEMEFPVGDEERFLDEQSAEVVHLDFFIRANHKALLALSAHFDKLTSARTMRWFAPSLLKQKYCAVDVDRLVLMLSVAWQKLRRKKEGRKTHSEAWKPPETFVRSTTKYWIRPENIVRAECLIVKHLPALVFGVSDDDLEMSLFGPLAASRGRRLSASETAPMQMVASVYFDSADAYSYERRIRRFEGAKLLRFRWYGSNHNEAEKEIFIERKTHHESWSGIPSAKQRFSLPQKLVEPYMLLMQPARKLLLQSAGFEERATEGRTASEEQEGESASSLSRRQREDAFLAGNKKLQKALQLAEEIQTEIEAQRLQPMLRTSYLRSAFQLAESNEVRISLDKNLSIVNEFREGRNAHTNWCRVAEELLGKNEVVRFPYAILEVKVQQQPPPDWVEDLLVVADATMVYKFSKFQHGMAFLHRNRIHSGLLPHWLQPQVSLSEDAASQGPSQWTIRVSLFDSWRRNSAAFTPVVFSGADPLADVNLQLPPRSLRKCSLNRRRLSADAGNMQDDSEEWEDLDGTCAASKTLMWLNEQQRRQRDRWERHRRRAGLPPSENAAQRVHEKRAPSSGSAEEADLFGSDAFKSVGNAEVLQRRLMGANIRTALKIDPKISFANERTMLHYTQKALYLAGASIACLTLMPGTVGLLLAVVLLLACAALALGSLAIFWRRARRIERKVARGGAVGLKQRIDSKWGPFFAVAAAAAAVLFLLAFQVDINIKHVIKHRLFSLKKGQ